MDKKVGSSAGILALFAVLLHSFGFVSGEKTEAPPSGAPAAKQAEKDPEKKKNDKEGRIDGQGPWLATQQFFHDDTAEIGASASCLDYLLGLKNAICVPESLAALFGLKKPDDVKILIATVPDPLHTRLAMETDRTLDSIQRAAFDNTWEFANQWLPWNIISKSDFKFGSPELRGLEHYPGLLVFRHHFEHRKNRDETMLVFTVAESPASGVNGFQFDFAKRFICKMQPNRNEVSIAGPIYSGSFSSLSELLEGWPGEHDFVVHSGQAANSTYGETMLSSFGSHEKAGRLSLNFHGYSLSSYSSEKLFQQLVKRMGLADQQVAEIAESGTGFSYSFLAKPDAGGASSIRFGKGSKKGAFPAYQYPRDIAQVRNIFNDSAFSNLAQGKKAKTADVEFSLKDAQSGEDTLPLFSANHSPVSQNAMLQDLIEALKRRKVQVANLSVTNIFDAVFLVNVLKRQCPEMRVVVNAPDLLFNQQISQSSLSGLMTFSMLRPLELESSRRAADVKPFPSENQREEYDAVASLLSDTTSALTIAPDRKAWLLELADSGWRAVDAFDLEDAVLRAQGKASLWLPAPAPSSGAIGPGEDDALPGASPAWLILCTLTAGFTLAFCGRLVYLHRRPDVLTWSTLCLLDLKQSSDLAKTGKVVYRRYLSMIACFASLAFASGLLLCPMLAGYWKWHLRETSLAAVAVIVAFAFMAAIVFAVRLAMLRVPNAFLAFRNNQYWKVTWPPLVFRVGIAIAFIAGLWSWWSCCTDGWRGYFLCLRTLAMARPLSPALPLLVATAGFFALSFFHLRRFTLGSQRPPRLDTSIFDKSLGNLFLKLRKRLVRNMYSPSEFESIPGVSHAIAFALPAIGLMVLLMPDFKLLSLERYRFNMSFVILLSSLSVLTIVTFVRFLRCWAVLKEFLSSINSTVIGGYVDRIPDFAGAGPIWMREMQLTSLTSAIDSAICLHNLQNVMTSAAFTQVYYGKFKAFLDPLPDDNQKRLSFLRAYRRFRLRAAIISKSLGTMVLTPYWLRNPIAFVGITTPSKATGAIQSATANPVAVQHSAFAAAATFASSAFKLFGAPPAAPSPKDISLQAYEYACRYIALQYSTFIGYVLMHLQNFLLCSTICFASVVIAIDSFAFQSSQVLSYAILATLVLAGVLTLRVLAQIERDPILSKLSGTQEGELGKDFYFRAAGYAALPLLSVLSAHFPAISRSVASWIEPAVSKLQ